MKSEKDGRGGETVVVLRVWGDRQFQHLHNLLMLVLNTSSITITFTMTMTTSMTITITMLYFQECPLRLLTGAPSQFKDLKP